MVGKRGINCLVFLCIFVIIKTYEMENTNETALKFLSEWVVKHGVNWDETMELASLLVAYAEWLKENKA